MPCGKTNGRWKGVGEIPHSYFTKTLDSAKKRNIPFNITIEDMAKLYDKQGGRCVLSGMPITFGKYKYATASIDRKDSSKGYTVDNIQWVHKSINAMKSNLSDERFVELCKAVAKTYG